MKQILIEGDDDSIMSPRMYESLTPRNTKVFYVARKSQVQPLEINKVK